MDCGQPVSYVHGILQARILEWVAMSSSRASSQPRDLTCISCVSCIGRRVLYQKHQSSFLVVCKALLCLLQLHSGIFVQLQYQLVWCFLPCLLVQLCKQWQSMNALKRDTKIKCCSVVELRQEVVHLNKNFQIQSLNPCLPRVSDPSTIAPGRVQLFLPFILHSAV